MYIYPVYIEWSQHDSNDKYTIQFMQGQPSPLSQLTKFHLTVSIKIIFYKVQPKPRVLPYCERQTDNVNNTCGQ